MKFRHRGRRVAKQIVVAIALGYFVLDLLFLSIVRPVRRHVMAWRWVMRMNDWVLRLNPYAALCLLLVPWIILEPLKPLGFLLFHHHHHLSATVIIIVSELGKLAIFDQIFAMTKPKLMTLHWFEWSYETWQAALNRLHLLSIWHILQAWREKMRKRWKKFIASFSNSLRE